MDFHGCSNIFPFHGICEAFTNKNGDSNSMILQLSLGKQGLQWIGLLGKHLQETMVFTMAVSIDNCGLSCTCLPSSTSGKSKQFQSTMVKIAQNLDPEIEISTSFKMASVFEFFGQKLCSAKYMPSSMDLFTERIYCRKTQLFVYCIY